ncbi:hypothetical protein PVAP13_2KG288467 [Panicum virgatum]|uniref:Uncharacterized protein n=1 Tax=Panicum virgatum TaxID=38727 RepID=A0A8T0W682_PANVG|nr:hypothetical protein PVAP13_2KG288467 [Panicum virgatum]
MAARKRSSGLPSSRHASPGCRACEAGASVVFLPKLPVTSCPEKEGAGRCACHFLRA